MKVMAATDSAQDWARYWRADGVPVEAMHAHFTSHVYHRRYYGVTPGAYRGALHPQASGSR